MGVEWLTSDTLGRTAAYRPPLGVDHSEREYTRYSSFPDHPWRDSREILPVPHE